MQDREDLYTSVHKGIRNCLQATLVDVGRLDLDDPADVAEKLGQVHSMIAMLAHHLSLEDDFVHTALERARPGLEVGTLRHDHVAHRQAFGHLGTRANELARACDSRSPSRHSLARVLNVELQRFVAENIEHMAVEETEMNAALWETFDDDAIREIRAQVLMSETEEQLAMSVRWLIPALPPVERAEVVLKARPSIPAEVFEHLLMAIRSLITPRDFAKLEAALALDQAA